MIKISFKEKTGLAGIHSLPISNQWDCLYPEGKKYLWKSPLFPLSTKSTRKGADPMTKSMERFISITSKNRNKTSMISLS